MNAKQIFKNTLDVALSSVLRKMGFQKFDNLRRILLSNGALEEDIAGVPDQDIWLIPAEQYDNIPKGYPVVDIFGNQTTFEGRKTCCKGDVRCGVLPIGILRPAESEEPATECKFVTNKAFIKGGKFYAIGIPATEAFMLQYAVEAYKVIEKAKPDNGSATVRISMLDKSAADKLANNFSKYKLDMLKYIKQLFKSVTDCGCGIVTSDEDDMSVIIYYFSSSSANMKGDAKLHAEVCKYLHDKFNVKFDEQ